MDFFARVARSGWILLVVNGLLQAGAMPCLAGVVVSENIAPGATSWPGGPLVQTVINPAAQVAVGESFNAVGGCTNYGQTFTMGPTNGTLQTISLYAGGGTGSHGGAMIPIRIDPP